MFLSIITVTYNDIDNIRKTLESIEVQGNKDFEWIIVDGESIDGTQNYIKQSKYQPSVFISEPDKGLYDAMNKGMEIAKGDYLVFMNAGDIFPTKDIVGIVKEEIVQNNFPDFVYGDALEVSLDKKLYLRSSRSISHKNVGMFTHHQSMYYRREIVERNNLSYNLKYKIAADYNFTCEFLNYSKQELYLNISLCKFELGGISTEQWYLGLTEYDLIRKEILKLTVIKRTVTHNAQVIWHILKYNIPLLHKLFRYKKAS